MEQTPVNLQNLYAELQEAVNQLQALKNSMWIEANQQYHRRAEGHPNKIVRKCFWDWESFEHYRGETVQEADGRKCHLWSEYERVTLDSTISSAEVLGAYKYWRDYKLMHPCYNCN